MANRVIIVGAGFGGLFAARKLAGKDVNVLLVDRNNYHTFTPLIYQVATCALDASEVAYPVRSIFYKNENINFLLGEVTHVDYTKKRVTIEKDSRVREEAFDYLILSPGSIPTYFRNDHFSQYAFELNSLENSVLLRNHVLKLFERAAWTTDFSLRDAMTTIVVVGGGPTGLETAGAIYELYNHVLDKEFRGSHMRARVILVEMQNNLLNPYPDKLQQSALKQLKSLGVEVMLGRRVDNIDETSVTLDDGSIIPTHTLVWSAGVKASPLAEMLEVELARAGRVPVHPTMEVIGRKNIFVIGDMAYLEDEDGNPYPMLIPVAQQQATLATKNILRDTKGEEMEEFSYSDRGIMATIGRRRAVAWIFKRFTISGYPAWVAWLGLHLVTLLGFRNRVRVLISWIWNYFTYDRSVRLILEQAPYDDPTREKLPTDVEPQRLTHQAETAQK